MFDKNESAWLTIHGAPIYKLIDHHRLDYLCADSITDNRCPILIHFFGDRERTTAVNYVFSRTSLQAPQLGSGTVSLSMADQCFAEHGPVLFSESNPSPSKPPAAIKDTDQPRNLEWSSTFSGQELRYLLHGRLLSTFTDIVCVFADDVIGPGGTWKHLLNCVRMGCASGHPSLRPILLIVRNVNDDSPTKEILDLTEIDMLENTESQLLRQNFSQVKLIQFAGHPKNRMNRFQALKDLLQKEAQQRYQLRLELGLLFSVRHFLNLFHQATELFCRDYRSQFRLIDAARMMSSKASIDAVYIKNFLSAVSKRYSQHGLPGRVSSTLQAADSIAAALLLDAYPVGAHRFKPQLIFKYLYQSSLCEALHSVFGSQQNDGHKRFSDALRSMVGDLHSSDDSLVSSVVNRIERRFFAMFKEINEHGSSASRIFKNAIKSAGLDWIHLKNPDFCICLKDYPMHTLRCGHALCDSCVRLIGRVVVDKVQAVDEEYHVDECPVCHQALFFGRSALSVALRPVTAGLRLLTLDGGGVRGKISLMILRMLQRELDGMWSLQELFDVVMGTSVGTDVGKAIDLFDPLARKLFAPNTQSHSWLDKLWSSIVTLWRDALYDPKALESCLKNELGADTALFHGQSLRTATKIGVVAADVDEGKAIVLTSYNTRESSPDGYYRPVQPSDGFDIKVWQAARATSAAPFLYPCVNIPGIGDLQDGGLSGHNNPIRIASTECRRLTTNGSDIDIAISVGTGVAHKQEPRSRCRHVFLDGFLQRLYRALMFHGFDGESIFQEFITNQADSNKHIRLNVLLPRSGIRMDDTSKLGVMEECVESSVSLKAEIHGSIYALIAASLYFKLHTMPAWRSHGFLCRGSLRSSMPGVVLIHLLSKFSGSKEFWISGRHVALAQIDGSSNLCSQCHRFSVEVEFHVANLEVAINIELQGQHVPSRSISSFPRPIQWFVQQQQLEKYGRSTREPTGCTGCDGPSNVGSEVTLVEADSTTSSLHSDAGSMSGLKRKRTPRRGASRNCKRSRED